MTDGLEEGEQKGITGNQKHILSLMLPGHFPLFLHKLQHVAASQNELMILFCQVLLALLILYTVACVCSTFPSRPGAAATRQRAT